MRDYDRKFARLEERLVKETADLRDDVKKRLAALEAYMKAEVESLSERLRSEQDGRTAGDKDVGRELRDSAQQFDQKVSQLDDLVARNQRDLRQQLHAQHQELGDDIRQRVEDVLGPPGAGGAGAAQRQDRSQGAGGAAHRDGDAAERRDSSPRAGRRGRCLTAPRRGRTIRRPAPRTRPPRSSPSCARCSSAPNSASCARCRPGSRIRPRRRATSAASWRRPSSFAPAIPHLQRALAPTIEDAITASVRRNPRPLADALFPIIGPAIRKAIAATLNGMLESLNTTLEHSLSWRSLRWRLDARRTGRPFAEIVLLNTLVYRVEQVFLIHRPSGLLLQHLTAPGTAAQDADMVSGMLTAIRDFVQDSFKVAEDEGLQTLKVGDLSVWIEQGPHALLAVVVRGAAPPSLRTTLQQALEAVHAQYSDLLESFDGNAARFEGARPLLETCLQQQFRGRERPGAPAAARHGRRRDRCCSRSGVWMFFALRARSRWNGYVNALRAEPGVVVVSTGRAGGKYVVTRPARSAGPRSRLAAAVPQPRTRRRGEPLGAVSGAAPVDGASPAPASSWRLPAA